MTVQSVLDLYHFCVNSSWLGQGSYLVKKERSRERNREQTQRVERESQNLSRNPAWCQTHCKFEQHVSILLPGQWNVLLFYHRAIGRKERNEATLGLTFMSRLITIDGVWHGAAGKQNRQTLNCQSSLTCRGSVWPNQHTVMDIHRCTDKQFCSAIRLQWCWKYW